MQQALALAQAAVEADPGYAQAHVTIADIYSAGSGLVFETSEVIPLAWQAVWTALELEPDNLDALYNLGWSYGMLDEVPEAVATFERALEVAPGEDYLIVSLAWAHARGRQRAEALAAVDRLSAEGRSGYDLAIVYWELGDDELAFDTLRELLIRDPIQGGQIQQDISATEFRADPRFDAILAELDIPVR